MEGGNLWSLSLDYVAASEHILFCIDANIYFEVSISISSHTRRNLNIEDVNFATRWWPWLLASDMLY